MTDYDYNKPPTSFSISKWGKNKKPHLFIGQPGIEVAVALFQNEKIANYFAANLGIAWRHEPNRSKGSGV